MDKNFVVFCIKQHFGTFWIFVRKPYIRWTGACSIRKQLKL